MIPFHRPAVTCLALLLAAPVLADDAGTAAPPPAATAFAGLKGNSAKGAVVYKNMCVGCHGPKGMGDGPSAKDLDPKPANFTDPERAAKITDEEVYRTVREGGVPVHKSPLMVEWKVALSDQQILDVATYIRTLSKPGPIKRTPAKK